MKTNMTFRQGLGAFTLIELLVVISIIAILASLLLPALAGAMRRAKRIQCVSNQRQVTLALKMWHQDNEGKFPWQVEQAAGGTRGLADAYRHYRAISNELSNPRLVACPADAPKIAATTFSTLGDTNVSLMVGLDASEALPMTILAGDRNLVGANNSALATERCGTANVTASTLRSNQVATYRWSPEIHANNGNLALADGSVQMTADVAMRRLVPYTGDPNGNNHVLKPKDK